ncbi:MAG: hypothetical protein P8Y48_16985 [Novosphingobium sp.]
MSDGSYITNQWGLELATPGPEDDELHSELCRSIGAHNCVETQFFGFSIPEENIHSINYFRHHPNMGHMLGGALVFQGMKEHFCAAELADYRIFNTDEPLRNGLRHMKMINSYETEVIEPLKRFRAAYSDPQRQNSFDLHYTAVAPPIGMKRTGHLEQTMRVQGELFLRGKRFDVDSLTIRNRTWGEVRDENHAAIPATSWMACTVDENFSFLVNAMDHPDLDPVWKNDFDIDGDKTLLGGWMYRDGEVVGLKSIRKITRYDHRSWVPTGCEFDLIDMKGRSYAVKMKIVAAVPYNFYLNLNAYMCLAEMEVNGQRGRCDFQDLQWTDMVNAMYRRFPRPN